MTAGHPLAALLTEAAEGRFPPADGAWRRVPPWRPGLEAVVAFTGHAVLAVADDVTDARLHELGVHGLGGAQDPRVVTALAGPDGWIDSLDALLVARGRGGASPLVERPDLHGHPRASFAAAVRGNLRVLGFPDPARSAVAVLGTGVGGLTELSVELEPERRSRGAGAALVRAALEQVPAGEPVVAAVAPGNAASLRAVLAAGFVPVGSSQLFRRAGSGVRGPAVPAGTSSSPHP
ncbi:N-acetyltransferase [Geodermatophilus sp. DF01-2]|uniref:N-acetyltransferase n=1 Tax=Geodermatophilus sp. DF01-2 TaxID=2559610 RepID=UPI001073B98B|nr:N-acetyltransferase [Geodermatophilus sp. DF01_2]TFV64516.1 N-acetyltransferase [Geodermatophilus sp. DF01_2]